MKRRVLAVPLGNFQHERGLQIINEDTLQRVLQIAKAEQAGIPVDFAHASFESKDAQTAGLLLADSLKAEPDGLYGELEWTKEAEAMIREKKFRYLSPVFTFSPEESKDGKLYIEKLVSLGLTNHPNIPAMKPLFNQLEMEEKMDELLTRLKEFLGLPDDAGNSELSESLFTRLGEVESLQKDLAALKEAAGLPIEISTVEVAAAIEKNANRLQQEEGRPTVEEWQTLKVELAEIKQRDLEAKVNSAIAEGKILPAQKEWAVSYAVSDPQGFGSFLVNSRPMVQMGELVEIAKKGNGKFPLSETQEKINKLLGISRKVFESFNQ